MRKKSVWTLSFVLCAVMLLSGCTASFDVGAINEMLTAPKLGQGQDEIQKVLADYLKPLEPQYKFPLEGEYRSPLVLVDFNGDGVDEAVLFYSVAGADAGNRKPNTVYLALLVQREDNWHVAGDWEGVYPDVASIEIANLSGDNTRQLLVGYGSPSAQVKILRTYRFAQEEDENAPSLVRTDLGEYTSYLLDDFMNKGSEQLAVVSWNESLKLDFFGYNKEEQHLQRLRNDAVPLYNNFTTCLGLHPSLGIHTSLGRQGEHLLIVDGGIMTDRGMDVGSQILVLSQEGAGFYRLEDDDVAVAEFAIETKRSSLLLAQDIDNDKHVEIPVPIETIPVEENESKLLQYLEWRDYTESITDYAVKSYGLFDSQNAIFVQLPDTWRETAKVLDGQDNEWVVQDKTSGDTLLSLRVRDEGGKIPSGAISIPENEDIYLMPSPALSFEDLAIIEAVFLS